MVDMVSSILTDYPVMARPLYDQGIIVISTTIWDFQFTKIDNKSPFIYDNVVISNAKLAEGMEHVKKTLVREIIGKYGITNCL